MSPRVWLGRALAQHAVMSHRLTAWTFPPEHPLREHQFSIAEALEGFEREWLRRQTEARA